MHFRTTLLSLLTALIPLSTAQTYSSCNPTTNTSCAANPGLNNDTYTCDFTKGSSVNSTGIWKTTAGSITWGDQGAEFIINKAGDAPTIQSNFYIFFGLFEVKLKAATGTGIVSSIVMESDDLDEIDWEFLGGNTTSAETNYFGKGNTTSYDRAIYYPVSTPQSTFHTYTVNWTSTSITWAIDGTVVRTLLPSDALNGKNYPQTPMNLRLGIWAGGDSSNNEGTIEWAGGETTYDDAPYTMYVESVYVENYNKGYQYVYGDQTGDESSIKIKSEKEAAAASATASGVKAAAASSTGEAAVRTSWGVVVEPAWAMKMMVFVACFVVLVL